MQSVQESVDCGRRLLSGKLEILIIPRGLTVRISGFHPEGPGSTPGVGTFLAKSSKINTMPLFATLKVCRKPSPG